MLLKSNFLIGTVLLIALNAAAKENASIRKGAIQKPSSFIENRGQVTDENGRLRSDVKFIYNAPGFKAVFTEKGFSYEIYTTDRKPAQISKYLKTTNNPLGTPMDETIHSSRVDVSFVKPLANPVIVGNLQNDGVENYYGQSSSGILNVRSFNEITYLNAWKGIDIVFTAKKPGELKYNLVVHKGADLSQADLAYAGQESLFLDNGVLSIVTTNGTITETVPASFLDGQRVSVGESLNGNIVGFTSHDNLSGSTLIIDPSLKWSTYYGSTGDDYIQGLNTDASGNLYAAGYTTSISNIATTGTYQKTYGGGTFDAYVVKFNSAGKRQWGTYYGGSGEDYGIGIACDTSGGVYFTGMTASSGLATSGAFQASMGGIYDMILVKLTSASGTRSWATYYGGFNVEIAFSVACDSKLNVVMYGYTLGSTGLASTNGYQKTISGGQEGILAKFSSTGTRLWGTYFGGPDDESCYFTSIDKGNNIYITGITLSTSGVATSGSFQDTFQSLFGNSAFLAKFNSSGSLKWSTYYGGEGENDGMGLSVDKYGFVYLAGYTDSYTRIATKNAYQGLPNGIYDAFLAKFDSLGKRKWGTYLGGADENYGFAVKADQASNNVYLTGYTSSTTDIASKDAYQSSFGGVYDMFLAQFDSSGKNRIYGTYLGDTAEEYAYAVTTDIIGNVYIGGTSTSGGLAVGGYQTKYGGATDGLIAKFGKADIGLTKIVNTGVQLCPSDSVIFKLVMVNNGNERDSMITVNADITGAGTFSATSDMKRTLKPFGGTDTLYFRNLGFATPGNYNIKFYVTKTDENSANDTIKTSLTVLAVPKPDFSYLSACAGNDIQFSNSTSGSFTSLRWNFGGGKFSTLTNPKFSFAKGGLYNVTLLATNANGCKDSITKQVRVYNMPKAAFSYSGGCLTDTFKFSNKTAVDTPATIASYMWKFGDGATSTLQNPTHQYSSSGTKTVTLIVTTDKGCVDSTSTSFGIFPPVAAFSAVNSCQSDPVRFINQSVVNPGANKTYTWDFGDSQTSTDSMPSHKYASGGTYTVKLKVSYSAGCSDQVTHQVTVYSQPVANVDVTDICLGDTAKFFDHAISPSGKIVSRKLTFGDKTSDTVATTTHVYSLAGNYTVWYYVTTEFGCKDSFTKQVNVSPVPNLKVSHTVNRLIAAFKVTDSSYVDYSWDFGDSKTSTLKNPSHAYSAVGFYNVKLTVTNANGCKKIFTDTVHIITNGIDNDNESGKGISIFPNPFNESTLLSYSLSNPSSVSVSLIDLNGKKVRNITTGRIEQPGSYMISIDGKEINAGVYILRLTVNDDRYERRLVKIK